MRKIIIKAILPAFAICCLLGSCQDKSSVDITIHIPESSAVSEEPTTTRREPTTGEKNALWSAQNYLDVSAFSKKGLEDQLEYEGYTRLEIAYAIHNCGADWKEQAVLKAQSYLEFMPFSREGLIDQLEYEGFTHNEAVYGADHSGY